MIFFRKFPKYYIIRRWYLYNRNCFLLINCDIIRYQCLIFDMTSKFKVYYIGLRGEFTKVNREAIVISNYEVVANPADHKTKAFGSAAHSIQ